LILSVDVSALSVYQNNLGVLLEFGDSFLDALRDYDIIIRNPTYVLNILG